MTRAKDERGQAMVEFVLVLPIFLGLVFLVIAFGITLNNYLRVTDIARVAARAAAIARFSAPSNQSLSTIACTAAKNAANAAAGGLTFIPSSGQPASCVCSPDSSCTPGNGNAITVTFTINSQNALTNGIPFLTKVAVPKTLTSKATVLLQ